MGRRFADDKGHLWLADGDYGKVHGKWYARPPGARMRVILGAITEHSDGTISTAQLDHDGLDGEAFCGCLERGVWRRS